MAYDIIIVGSGTGGMFASLKLSENRDKKILVIERGSDLPQRIKKEDKKDILYGIGGSGSFSDGKLLLNVDSEVGGNLVEHVGFSKTKQLIEEVDKTYLHFGAPTDVYEPDKTFFTRVRREALTHSLKLIPSKIRHCGSDNNIKIVANMKKELDERGVEFLFKCRVDNLRKEGDVFAVSYFDEETEQQKVETAKYVIVSVGRSGGGQFRKLFEEMGVELSDVLPVVDCGVRAEFPNFCAEHLTKTLYEPKLIHYDSFFDSKCRTFCCNVSGRVVREYNIDGNFYTVNGHSLKEGDETGLTNMALLVSERFTQPFDNPTEFGVSIAKLSNLLGKEIVVQRVHDLLRGRRSTPTRMKRLSYIPTLKECEPGDGSLCLPYRHLSVIISMLKALSGIMPGILEETVLYFNELKFYSNKYKLSKNMESNIENLFIVGDCSGLTRSLVHAACSSWLACEKILERY